MRREGSGRCREREELWTSLGLEETAIRVEVGNELWMVEIPTGDGRPYGVHDYAAVQVTCPLG